MRKRRPAPRRTKKSNRGSRSPQHFTSIVIDTLQTKQSHKKEEIYPIPLSKLINRSNGGMDADVRLTGYTISCVLATGNDCTTVSINIGHAGPWVRRGDSITDSFDQQFVEHTFRGKSCLFRKFLIGTSERQFLNPDIATNFLYLRVRDPCGVIPGVVIKYEFRAFLVRSTPASFFANPGEDAVDRYEDQDVSTGSPAPPSGVKHVPALIRENLGARTNFLYLGEDDPSNSQWIFKEAANPRVTYMVAYTNPKQTLGAIFTIISQNPSDLQLQYNTAGFDGTISHA